MTSRPSSDPADQLAWSDMRESRSVNDDCAPDMHDTRADVGDRLFPILCIALAIGCVVAWLVW